MDKYIQNKNKFCTAVLLLIIMMSVLVGGIGGHALAQLKGPTEHKGISVTALGEISEESMRSQIGLEGYYLRMRSAIIEPGGQVAEHDHKTRPGLVKVISGTWTEGRPDGEYEFKASKAEALLEHQNTVHWIYNRSNEPATAIICDIMPST
jgi:quercetin dioxygenase-like cupin family protein